tara:strand:- start:277 stop:432 length:156 start_codon:yes stop_codon:yes gene_type:complete
MISMLKHDLIGIPHKSLIEENLFDFMKKRENISLCGSEKSVLQLISRVFVF